jgi:hypothetical protein
MLDEYKIVVQSDQSYFVKRHYQKLIRTIQEPDSDYPVWLGDALAFLVENLESFPEMNNYFDLYLYREILEWMRRPDSTQPSWLVDALEYLVKNVEYFPPPGDEDAYVVEYIYPH